MKSDNRWIWITIGSIIVIFAAFSVLSWKIGLFDFTGTDASAKIVAASIALIGGFIGSLVTVIGILLKHSIDQRAEKRLKVEAAIQSVQLLSTSSGKEVPATQRAGVLFTLVSLGLPELAIKMLNQMFPNDRIDASTACWLIEYGIKSNNESLQYEAVNILNENAEKLLIDKGSCEFPRCFTEVCDTKVSEYVRGEAAKALLKLIATRPYSDWNMETLNRLVIGLKISYETEPSHTIRNGVALGLEKIIRIYPPRTVLCPTGSEIDVDDLKTNLSKFVKKPNLDTTDFFRHLSRTLEQWSKTKPSKG